MEGLQGSSSQDDGVPDGESGRPCYGFPACGEITFASVTYDGSDHHEEHVMKEKAIKLCVFDRYVIQTPDEEGVEHPLSVSEFNSLKDYGTICYPNDQDLIRYPRARVIVFFKSQEEHYILAFDAEGETYPSCKALFGGFIEMSNRDRLYFGPNMAPPMIPENMLTRDAHEHECRELDLVTWEKVTPIEQKLIDYQDEVVSEIDDIAMVRRRESPDHFKKGNRAQYLTPALMPDDSQEMLIAGRFKGFLQMTDAMKPHAMVFEITHPSLPTGKTRNLIIPLPSGCWIENEDVSYIDTHPSEGESSDDHHYCKGTSDQAEESRPLE